ncbi:hypothetical protein NIM87_09330 [Devosia sp. XJ19-1]|uniref:Uncharacterized protein n=1 Tax=Devosia ureilytica TaxID=2952754 RepID=A0A9Q4APD7_9HYPH|nr:hypothetical protein [Devosia ureilytica]MCP8883698.1 hypothetical protein [Devosia ureilytica]MCP8887306.1 hypothetical protein [Devosia ureilytica]
MDQSIAQQLFPHIRIVLGTIIGLGITRILMTLAGILQHPSRAKVSALHLLWMGSILLELVLFWWWEFALHRIEVWHFGLVLFIMTYAITLFLMAALLSPDNISEYTGYEDFFLKRRHWFFGILAATFLLDTIDTFIKGQSHWNQFDWSYFSQVPLGLLLCIWAWRSTDRRAHMAIVAIHIAYQAFLITRYFSTVG